MAALFDAVTTSNVGCSLGWWPVGTAMCYKYKKHTKSKGNAKKVKYLIVNFYSDYMLKYFKYIGLNKIC